MRRSSVPWIVIGLILLIILDADAQKPLARRVCVGFEGGSWLPHSLNDEPRFITFGAAGATAYLGVFFYAPIASRLGLRFSLGYWSLRDLERIEDVHSLVIYPVAIDVKYWLLSDTRLAAYAIYGMGIYWGIENETMPFDQNLREARGGWGANVGAGFDVGILRWLGLGMLFQYHYVSFKQPIGGVDDFSGPKITAVMTLYF